jgi:hypothetical protein
MRKENVEAKGRKEMCKKRAWERIYEECRGSARQKRKPEEELRTGWRGQEGAKELIEKEHGFLTGGKTKEEKHGNRED